MTCSFFGNYYVFENIKPLLFDAVEELILNEKVDEFFVGNNGNFDKTVWDCLVELREKYKWIRCTVVFAYLQNDTYADGFDYRDTLFPDILENVPKKYAIIERNKWMIRKSDYVITYIATFGNAIKMKEYAQKKNKIIIELFNCQKKIM